MALDGLRGGVELSVTPYLSNLLLSFQQREIVDRSMQDAITFLTYQQDNNPKCRGPFLARMELQSRYLARRFREDEHTLVILMRDYFENFGSKQCAAMDLKLFLPSLDEDNVTLFFEEIYDVIGFEDGQKTPKNVDQIQHHVCWYQLQRLMGRH